MKYTFSFKIRINNLIRGDFLINKSIKQMTNREIEQMKMEMANELSLNLTNEKKIDRAKTRDLINKIERKPHDESLDMFYPFV